MGMALIQNCIQELTGFTKPEEAPNITASSDRGLPDPPQNGDTSDGKFLGLNPILAAAAGLGILCCVLALVLCTMVVCRRRRQRLEDERMHDEQKSELPDTKPVTAC